MKRMLTLLLALLLTAGLTVSAFAAGNFTKSPTVQPLPMKPGTLPQVVDDKGNPVTGNENKPIEVIPVTDESDGKYKITGDSINGCNVTMWVTPYGEKSRLVTLDEGKNPDQSVIAKQEVDAKDRLEVARADIDQFDSNFTEWKGIWKKDAHEVLEKTKNRDVTVVSVFDVTIWCDTHTHEQLSDNVHHHIHNISLKLDENQLKNFVSLMHFNKNYVWEYVPSVVDEAASTISFSVDCANLSPFAIVAYSEGGSHGGGGGGSETGEPTSPQTGEIGNGGYWMSCGMFFAVAGVTALYRQKKEKRYAR